MEQQMKAAKQVIEMQKAGFDNMMSSTFAFWDQSEQMLNSFLGLVTWMPEEMKDTVRQRMVGNKQALEFYRNSIDAGFDNLKKLLDESKLPFGY